MAIRTQTNFTQAFQEGAWQWSEPDEAFQHSAFHGYPAFQLDEETGGFQFSAFDDEGFQSDLEGFQDTAYQPDGFQIDEPLGPSGPPPVEPAIQPVVRSRRKSDRFFSVRQHRQARILKAPQPAPIIIAVPKPVVRVTEDRRAVFAARRKRKPVIIRSRVLDSPRARVQVHERSRNPLIKRRRRNALPLRAPVAAPPSKSRVTVHERPRSSALARLRRRKPLILRGVSTPTPPPVTGIPAKRVFVSEDRRSAFIRARRRNRIILRAPSVPTPVPWIRNHVYVAKRRIPLQARTRHKPRLLRSFVAPVRPPLQLVRKQRRRLQQKRKRAILVRSVPLWQRPRSPIIVGQHRKASLVARARHRLRLIVSRNLGPPPVPSTASAFGQVFLSDLPLYDVSLADGELYAVTLKDGELYAVSLDDLAHYDVSVNDSAVYETSLSDIPGG